MLPSLQRNLFPALAVLILPCGYYAGVLLHEQERQARLLEQREALAEERQALLQKIKLAKEETA
ncbi:hypothetical protein F4703DRAFT_1932129 [Phycomyces blakesleeanus]|uniref:Uncharacterized protein n=1 Tax=Phycomyces blakesleeanus (strain ATCC 8743b / DSM 1359 / FGSC 10004 / NBRC 33097 / NRRL 1555) TaxID=763407 RepID=A0A162X7G2_PHYB8|nr:hypothetical protein PHYBLDRAFT_146278 [Phycomyces blakesleeanus NRRL 1555(-)]OAD72965.1 hypothetical protein PHYBLDRAFT_146278 [Phycomyces blakesleeanus NRRL 1555(-)]|eukprot:XP_018291005.1 hypothetical protein PHYBLDRAFT_146278 [Phycomyces blakesleeanus NRRL 1555(-)]